MLAKLSSKGQLVIPKKVRERLNLRPGAQFHIQIDDEQIILKPLVTSVIDSMYGKYADVNLVSELENEHRQEIIREATIRS